MSHSFKLSTDFEQPSLLSKSCIRTHAMCEICARPESSRCVVLFALFIRVSFVVTGVSGETSACSADICGIILRADVSANCHENYNFGSRSTQIDWQWPVQVNPELRLGRNASDCCQRYTLCQARGSALLSRIRHIHISAFPVASAQHCLPRTSRLAQPRKQGKRKLKSSDSPAAIQNETRRAIQRRFACISRKPCSL